MHAQFAIQGFGREFDGFFGNCCRPLGKKEEEETKI